MKVSVVASTKLGEQLSMFDSLRFSGIAAGICYMPNSIDALMQEPVEKSINRIKNCIKSGHHSVLDHVVINFSLENVPKILAMFLNNEQMYTTSEKSARYTVMETSSKERELYEKWISLFELRIKEVYPNISEKQRRKLAMENARYLISIFTPATSLLYSVSLRQLNLIIHWMKKFIMNSSTDLFSMKVKEVFRKFLMTNVSGTCMHILDFTVDGMNDGPKDRSFSLIANTFRKEEFGECYCTNYMATFAQLAQAQRHRTLEYEMTLVEKNKYKKFYIPPIIRHTQYEEMWINDINSLAENFPQGQLIYVNERGTSENFILKCMERLCGQAQLEIAQQTEKTMKKYLKEVKDARPEIYQRMLPYSHGARCTFPGWQCGNPCIFGPKEALKRLI